MTYRRLTEDNGFRCGRYRASWTARTVHAKANAYRFEIVAGGVSRNTDSAAEALRLARLHADTGADVTVRDRSKRRGYLTEQALEALLANV